MRNKSMKSIKLRYVAPIVLGLLFVPTPSYAFLDSLKKIGGGIAETLETADETIQKKLGTQKTEPTDVSAPQNTNRKMTAEVQKLLNTAGYNAGSPDGVYGGKTKNAILKYERDNGLPQKGDVTENLLSSLQDATSTKTDVNYDGGSIAKAGLQSAAACGGLATLTGASEKNIGLATVACGAGGAVMKALEQKGQQEYAQEYETITKEMVATEKELEQLEQQTTNNLAKANNSDAEVKSLIQNEKDNREFILKSSVLREKLDNQIRDARKTNNTYRSRQAVLEEDIRSIDEIIAENPDEKALKEVKVALTAQKEKLIKDIKKSNTVQAKLAENKALLDSEIIKRS